MALTQFDLILAAIRGVSLTRDEASDLQMAISARVDSVEADPVIPKSTATAECALTAVYAAIEQQAGYQDVNLAGLAALVTALKPRTPLQML